eukprot:scaffold289547_cov28-Tisochrysis_lutea.AAC.3
MCSRDICCAASPCEHAPSQNACLAGGHSKGTSDDDGRSCRCIAPIAADATGRTSMCAPIRCGGTDIFLPGRTMPRSCVIVDSFIC